MQKSIMSAEFSILRLSLGSAVVLGLVDKRIDATPTTIYVMTPGKCVRDCKYCSEAKSSSSLPNMLSRVTWPPFPVKEVVKKIKSGEFNRLCIQTVNNKDSKKAIKNLLKEISTFLPVSVCINTYSEKFIEEMFQLGVDRIGLPIDAVNPEIYRSLRGGSFFKKLDFILRMGKKYSGRITTHIIVGLGESDFEILNLYEKFVKNKISVGLFAFTPVRGTKLQNMSPPDISRYRKIQVATKLLEDGFKLSSFKFMDGNLKDLPEFSIERLKKLKPFNTRGCPYCNRPFYNEKPKGIMYNYPYELSEEEWKKEISLLRS